MRQTVTPTPAQVTTGALKCIIKSSGYRIDPWGIPMILMMNIISGILSEIFPWLFSKLKILKYSCPIHPNGLLDLQCPCGKKISIEYILK